MILRAHTGTGVSHSQHRKNSGEALEKIQLNGPEGWKSAKKKSLAVSVASVSYTHLTLPTKLSV